MDFVWGCSPENVDKLVATLFDEIKKLKADGPTESDLTKVKETLIRERETVMKDNNYWQQILENSYRRGDKILTIDEYRKMIKSVKSKDIRKVARIYLNEENYVQGELMPLAQEPVEN